MKKTQYNYCNLCGKKKPEPNSWHMATRRCDVCYIIARELSVKAVFGKNHFCIFCGKRMKNTNAKFCCNPKGIVAVSRSLMKMHPEKIRIISTCNCKNVRKILHHPDHTKPFDVYGVCFPCHFLKHNPYKKRNGWDYNNPTKYQMGRKRND